MILSLKKVLSETPIPIQMVFKIYLLGMGVSSFYRLLLLISNYHEKLNNSIFLCLKSLWVGIRFDTTISCYLLVLPLLLYTINYYLFKQSKAFQNVIHIITILLYCTSFFVLAVDIPFFNFFSERLSTSILLWGEDTNISPFIFFQHWPYLWPILVFISSLILFIIGFKKINKSMYNKSLDKQSKFSHLIYFMSFLTLFFFAHRGKVDFTVPPLDIRDAYHSDNSFYNKVSLNPIYSFGRSYLNSLLLENESISFMPTADAIKNVQEYLKIDNVSYETPIARYVKGEDSLMNDYNVVLVIMESMTSHKVGRFGNKFGLTPNLDSLAQNGISFDNFYSAGIHTYNGVFSSLYSYPAIYRQKPTLTSPINEYYGMPQVLKEQGYQSAFFTTHNESFDNLGGFLTANSFDEIYSDKNYPKEKLIGAWGVTDDYMFEYAIGKMNEMSKNESPFLSVLLTCSDHAPYTLPDYYNPRNTDLKHQIVEYVDWSIGKFIKEASKEDWYKNTLFVFVSDHGQSMNVTYEMPLSLNQIPCIIYNPNIVKAQSVENFGGQIDIFPTLMGLMNKSYVNSTMGIDILKDKRPYAFFNGDDKFGVISDSLFYVYRDNGIESVYKYKEKDLTDYISDYSSQTEEMKTYSMSFLETYQWILNSNLEGKPNEIK